VRGVSRTRRRRRAGTHPDDDLTDYQPTTRATTTSTTTCACCATRCSSTRALRFTPDDFVTVFADPDQLELFARPVAAIRTILALIPCKHAGARRGRSFFIFMIAAVDAFRPLRVRGRTIGTCSCAACDLLGSTVRIRSLAQGSGRRRLDAPGPRGAGPRGRANRS